MESINVYLEYQERQISEKDLTGKVKAVWKDEKKSVKDIKSLTIYVKPEELKAYYVINETELGSVDF